jgi:hypothetical protein
MPLLEVYNQHAIASAIREREYLRHHIDQNQPKAAISGRKQIIPPLRNNHVVIGNREQSCIHRKSVTTISALEVRITRAVIRGQEESPRISIPNFLHPLLRSGNGGTLYICRDRDASQVSIWLKKGSIHAVECHNGLFS